MDRFTIINLKIFIMKKVIFVSLFLAAGVSIFSACNNNKKKEGNGSTINSTNGSGVNSDNAGVPTGKGGSSDSIMSNSSAPPDTTPKVGSNMDKACIDFITKAASSGMMEVELGNMAAQKAQNQRVKNFGSMMVTDHTQVNNELKSIISGKNITIPTTMSSEHQREVDRMKNKAGEAFDKAYMKMMVEDHKKDVSEFKKASTTLKNADVKGFASRTLPVLQKHLDSAQAINSKM